MHLVQELNSKQARLTISTKIQNNAINTSIYKGHQIVTIGNFE